MTGIVHKYDHRDQEGRFGPAIPADALDLPVNIGRPAHGALAYAGITRLEDLNGLDERSVAELHGVGPKAIRILKAALTERGMAFAPTVSALPVGTSGKSHGRRSM